MGRETLPPASSSPSNPQPAAGWHNEALPGFQHLNKARDWLHTQTRRESGNNGFVRGAAHVGGRAWSILCVVTNIISAALSAIGSPFTAFSEGNYCGKKFVGSCRQVGASFVAIFVDNAPNPKSEEDYRAQLYREQV